MMCEIKRLRSKVEDTETAIQQSLTLYNANPDEVGAEIQGKLVSILQQVKELGALVEQRIAKRDEALKSIKGYNPDVPPRSDWQRQAQQNYLRDFHICLACHRNGLTVKIRTRKQLEAHKQETGHEERDIIPMESGKWQKIAIQREKEIEEAKQATKTNIEDKNNLVEENAPQQPTLFAFAPEVA